MRIKQKIIQLFQQSGLHVFWVSFQVLLVVVVMSWVEQQYSDISPVTLQVVGGAMSSRLYCQEVEGLSQVESFLVELYRCKVCQFTCGLRSAISNHLLLRHHPSVLTCLSAPDGGEVAQEGAEPDLQRMDSPYQLDLNEESKQSDEDEEFLLYNMLENMSPPTCSLSTEEGLQVAHTCEVKYKHLHNLYGSVGPSPSMSLMDPSRCPWGAEPLIGVCRFFPGGRSLW